MSLPTLTPFNARILFLASGAARDLALTFGVDNVDDAARTGHAMDVGDDNEVDTLLASFPGPLALRPARAKWLRLFVIGLIFVALDVWFVRAPDTFANPQNPDAVARFFLSLGLARDARQVIVEMGWAGLLFFGACTALCAMMLAPGAASLNLDSEGFSARQMIRSQKARWRDVQHFEPVTVKYGFGSTSVVGYDRVSLETSRLGAMNVRLTGRNSALPDTYGLAAGDLARLMATWRERALKS
jgi:hypothetical protein